MAPWFIVENTLHAHVTFQHRGVSNKNRCASLSTIFFWVTCMMTRWYTSHENLPIWTEIYPIWNLSRQGRGALCESSPKSQHIFKTARTLELLLCDFSFYVFSIKKRSVPPTSPHVCFHGNPATFWLILENSNGHCLSSISTWEKLSMG